MRINFWQDRLFIYFFKLFPELIRIAYCRQWQDELSSSKVVAEVDVGKAIASDAVPSVEKFHKASFKIPFFDYILIILRWHHSFMIFLVCYSSQWFSFNSDFMLIRRSKDC